jgi:hypothetical protein
MTAAASPFLEESRTRLMDLFEVDLTCTLIPPAGVLPPVVVPV